MGHGKDADMDDMTKFTPFKREDHVYHNEAFAELCKDAVRAFNGTPVCELPPPRFTGSGVYAIYCTARKGIYERYGNKVNRMGYNVPIYVGKAVPKGCANGDAISFDMLPCHAQLEFWHKKINAALGLSINDFRCRVYPLDKFGRVYIGGIFKVMYECFRPAWNMVFADGSSLDGVASRWCEIHSERFHSKADKTAQEELRHYVDVA